MKTLISVVSKTKLVFILSVALCLVACQSHKEVKNYSIVEIIDTNSVLDAGGISEFSKQNNISAENIYNWENHWVFYVVSDNSSALVDNIRDAFADVEVKLYDSPFYNFICLEHCDEKCVEERTNIIMTANLVDDKVMQDEYMEYHYTQFEEWPEVSDGFCNAHFQQLQVFRNGRQLMLVISIPKGDNLDNLNPKTVENNLRVDEWNEIMSKYQEGIEDAPEGVVWIELEKIN